MATGKVRRPQPSIPIRGPLTQASFVDRPNRFLVRTRLEDGRTVPAHLPDPGRLKELLVPNRRVWLRPAQGTPRKTSWTVVLVQTPSGDGLVSVDTTLPNRLIAKALRTSALGEFAGWTLVRAEVPVGASRLDFILESKDRRQLLLEVKSVTLVENGVGL
ncbi:MAG: DNA/RNA nuclease SfsA, partial [Thermoplasmata archaeon]